MILETILIPRCIVLIVPQSDGSGSGQWGNGVLTCSMQACVQKHVLPCVHSPVCRIPFPAVSISPARTHVCATSGCHLLPHAHACTRCCTPVQTNGGILWGVVPHKRVSSQLQRKIGWANKFFFHMVRKNKQVNKFSNSFLGPGIINTLSCYCD